MCVADARISPLIPLPAITHTTHTQHTHNTHTHTHTHRYKYILTLLLPPRAPAYAKQAEQCSEWRSASQSPLAAAVSIRQHTSAYVSIRQHTSRRGYIPLQRLRCQYLYCCTSKAVNRVPACYRVAADTRKQRPAYVSVRQHTSAYVSIRDRVEADARKQLPAVQQVLYY